MDMMMSAMFVAQLCNVHPKSVLWKFGVGVAFGSCYEH